MTAEVPAYRVAAGVADSRVAELGQQPVGQEVVGLASDHLNSTTMTFHDQKMKIHELSAQHIFPSKRYTTCKCIAELVVI